MLGWVVLFAAASRGLGLVLVEELVLFPYGWWVWF